MKSYILFRLLLVAVLTITANLVNGAPRSSSNFLRRDDFPQLPPVPPAYDPKKDTFARVISTRCTAAQIANESLGWGEAGIIANAMTINLSTGGWKPGFDYQGAFNMYMGTDSDSNWGIFWSYRQRISNLVNNQKGIHDGTRGNIVGNLGGTRYEIFVFCDEEQSPYKGTCAPGVGAYTWYKQWNYWSVYEYVVLCPWYFVEAPPLADMLRDVRENPDSATDIYSIYFNKGYVWFHECFHWQWMVTDPRAKDHDPDNTTEVVYGPDEVQLKATIKNAYATSVIADAYSVTGLAMVLMQIFKLADPPTPLAQSAVQNNWKSQDIREAPADWTLSTQGDVNSNTSYAPDPSAWINTVPPILDMSLYVVDESIPDPTGSSTSIASSTTSVATTSSTGTPCQGNQVQASGCVTAIIPTSTPYSGVKPPSCNRADGAVGSKARLSATFAQLAASGYCAQLISDSVVLSAPNTQHAPYNGPGLAENNAAMSMTVTFDVGACPLDMSMKTLDFKSLGQARCFANMYTSIAAVCVQDSTWAQYNAQYTLEGGVFENDCGLWAMFSA